MIDMLTLVWHVELVRSALLICCAGMLAAAAGGHPEAVTAYLLDGVPFHTLHAMLRSWLAAKAGLQSGAAAAGNAAGDQAAAGETLDDDLLFYVSTQGDAAGAVHSYGDEGDDSGSDGGLDMAQLPGSDGDTANGDDSGDVALDTDESS
jgi:hypothetical protein